MQGEKENAMSVSGRNLAVLIALVLGLALATSTFAKGNSTTFSLSQTMKLAGTTLPAGDYQVVLSDTTATFKQRGKVVAEAHGQWNKATAKDAVDAIVRDSDGRILEIHLEGRDSYFVIG
jgi:hypothetical protein